MILGSGGFERNLEMREKYQPQPTSVEWTTGSEFNTGGGILAGITAGAQVDLGLVGEPAGDVLRLGDDRPHGLHRGLDQDVALDAVGTHLSPPQYRCNHRLRRR